MHTHYEDLVTTVGPPQPESVVERVYTDAQVNVVRIWMPAGGVLADHKARHPVIVQVLSGSVRFRIEQEEITLRPTSWLHVPAREPHEIEAREPTVLLVTMLKGPDSFDLPT